MTVLPAAFKDWLFRWQKSDGSGPVVLTQRRIFILPSRAGLLFATALAVMLLGAINYTLALGHALVFLLAGLGMAGMVHTFRNLAGLCIAPGRPEAVFAGETAHFPLHLVNDRPTPRLGLEFQAGDGALVACDVAADGRREIALPVPAARRGWLELPRVRLSTRYPLGLFVAWSYPRPALRCLVYPRPGEFPLPPALPAAASGERQGDAGQEDFAGFRPHQPADSPRHVAWKAVARDPAGGPLLVKQFAGGAASELWLDRDLLPAGIDPESGLSILTGWVLAAEAAGLAYGLRLVDSELAPASGEGHRRRCLEALALAAAP